MSRIDDTMAELHARKRKALVTYLCMGDPNAAESVDLAVACAEAGADILELGVPFSDPTADGPVIARASQRALAAGGGLSAALECARAVRARCETPIVLFGYYHPIFVRGEARLARDAKAAGVDGLLVVDLPVDEAGPLRAVCKDLDLSLVPLLAPTSSESRVDKTAQALRECAPGFVYYVSLTGVTGSAAAPLAEAGKRAAELAIQLAVPVVVGFGIDSPEKARQASAADGVVVGSALVKLVADGRDAAERRRAVSGLVGSLRAGLENAL